MRSRELLEKLKGEAKHGATFCAYLALSTFFEMEGSENPVEIAAELLRAKPEMAPIVSIAVACLEHFEREGTREGWLEGCQKIKKVLEEAPRQIAEWLLERPETGSRILTCSYSDTVYQALIGVSQARSLEVATTEGRPLCEGTLMAKRLAYAGIPVTLGVDAAALTLLEGCDAVWIGADAIGSEFFVNKVGTRALVLGAKVMQKPVLVLADPLKRWPKDREWKEGKHSGDEVLGGAEPPLTIINPYFEKIPLEWVTTVFPETGSLR